MRQFSKIKNIKAMLKNKNGFSMIELLVAISLSSIIMIMVYSSNRIILNSIKKFSNLSEFYREYNLAYYRIDKDFSSVFFDPSNKDLVFSGSSNEGIVSNSNVSFVTISKNDIFMSEAPDKITMDSDIKTVDYYLKQDPSFPEVNFLIRKEYIMYNKVTEEFEEETVKNFSEESILLKNVKDIKFEYYDGKWDTQWDSSLLKKIPKAVKTTIIINDFNGREYTFSFISNPGLSK